MTARLAQIYSVAWRAAIVLLTVQVSIDATLRYIAESQPAPEPIFSNAFASPFLVLHVVGAMIALMAGPLQFVRAIRTRLPAFHRMTGRIYLLGCAVGAPTGLVLALERRRGRSLLLPFGYLISDLAENFSIAWLIRYYPTRYDGLTDALGYVTLLKRACMYEALLVRSRSSFRP